MVICAQFRQYLTWDKLISLNVQYNFSLQQMASMACVGQFFTEQIFLCLVVLFLLASWLVSCYWRQKWCNFKICLPPCVRCQSFWSYGSGTNDLYQRWSWNNCWLIANFLKVRINKSFLLYVSRSEKMCFLWKTRKLFNNNNLLA